MYYVYVLASRKNGTLYNGVTSDLKKRMDQHKGKAFDGFSNKYDVNKLVYYEEYTSAETAIVREKQLKNWHRAWKMDLIESKNPEWEDLYGLLV